MKFDKTTSSADLRSAIPLVKRQLESDFRSGDFLWLGLLVDEKTKATSDVLSIASFGTATRSADYTAAAAVTTARNGGNKCGK
jgi:hypothetical protein